ncbi:ribbon-helix-helix domain-containing protein [Aggregatibacter segnis]|uniref:ribbon-helix-helix domain-containing protein n=1 Tax=Aggregatibacter segnis TaxID=739 RepID=UPI000D6E7C06|nr:ribbon-helix-helix domain-containing protein [Aggregatibacter segnis]
MSYEKLKKDRKKAISSNANTYSKKNYKDVSMKVKPEVAAEFSAICEKEGVSKAEMLRRFIYNYNSSQNT